MRLFLLAEEATQSVLQIRFLLLAIRLVSLIALDCLEKGVLKVPSDSAPNCRTEHRV